MNAMQSGYGQYGVGGPPGGGPQRMGSMGMGNGGGMGMGNVVNPMGNVNPNKMGVQVSFEAKRDRESRY
jgi:hypothetical protein